MKVVFILIGLATATLASTHATYVGKPTGAEPLRGRSHQGVEARRSR